MAASDSLYDKFFQNFSIRSLHLIRFQLDLFRFGDFLISFFTKYFRLSINEFTIFYSLFPRSFFHSNIFFCSLNLIGKNVWLDHRMIHYLVCHSGKSRNECMLWMFRTCPGILFISTISFRFSQWNKSILVSG